jgi:dienelactone hydrolase
MFRYFTILIILLLQSGCIDDGRRSVPAIDRYSIRTENLIWNLEVLQKAPGFRYLDSTSSVREIIFDGPDHYGRRTKVFAYYSNPDILKTGANRGNKFPGIVLISGGDQEAIREWVERWAYEGYAAITCDYGNQRKMPEGVPTSSTPYIYDSIKYGYRSVREYRSVEIAILAHSLLLSFPEVDQHRTAVTGISWGGFQTCIVAGIDNRFKAAVPVYGCGYHDQTIFKRYFKEVSPEDKSVWMQTIDPSNYIGFTKCPVLFVNGNTDGCFDILPWYKTTLLVPEQNRYLCMIPGMNHDHPNGWRPREIASFINYVLNNGVNFAKIINEGVSDSIIHFTTDSKLELKSATFWFSKDTLSSNAERIWKSIPAKITGNKITCPVPREGFLFGFLFTRDIMELGASGELIIMNQE